MGIEEIVKVDIQRGTQTITTAGFGTALILSSDAVFVGVRTYNSIKAVEADFATNTSTYKWTQRLFGQKRKPRQIKIARRTALVAQVNTIKILNNADGPFTVTIEGVDYTFVAAGSTIAQIRTGLIAAIEAAVGTHGVTAANGLNADEFTLTDTIPGRGFALGVTGNLQNTATTPNNSVANDLSAAALADQDWYCALLTSRTKLDIMTAAAWIETRRKIFLACNADADVKTNTAGNVAAELKAKGYSRTSYFWSADQANGPEAALAGRCLPLAAGSETWKFKDLVGITPDIIDDTTLNNFKLNNVNNYRTFAGFSMTAEGQVAVGEFIDVIRFVDQLQAWIEEEVFRLLVSVDKVPFTDPGLAKIENVVTAQLNRGVSVGGLAAFPKPVVVTPKVADIAVADRAARIAKTFTFTATLAGAVHFVEVNGTVSV